MPWLLLLLLFFQDHPPLPGEPLPKGHVPYGTPPTRDRMIRGWEFLRTDIPELGACEQLDEPLTVPVSRSRLAEAIRLLRHVSARPLADAEAARFIDENAEGAEPLSVRRVQSFLRFIGWDGEEPPKHYVSDESDIRLIKQRLKDGYYDRYRPYLVRAATKWPEGEQGTPVMGGVLCQSGLVIHNLLFSYTIPPSAKQPVVVFLPREPGRVYPLITVGW